MAKFIDKPKLYINDKCIQFKHKLDIVNGENNIGKKFLYIDTHNNELMEGTIISNTRLSKNTIGINLACKFDNMPRELERDGISSYYVFDDNVRAAKKYRTYLERIVESNLKEIEYAKENIIKLQDEIALIYNKLDT